MGMAIYKARQNSCFAKILELSSGEPGDNFSTRSHRDDLAAVNDDRAALDRRSGDRQDIICGQNPHLFRSLLGTVTGEYRCNVASGRWNRDAFDEIAFGNRRGVRILRPFLNAARAGIIGREGHGRLGVPAAILLSELFQVPASGLNISLRIGEKFIYIFGRLFLKFLKTAFFGPFAGDGRRYLHESDFVSSTHLPRPEISFLIDQAPDEFLIQTIDASLSGNQLIVSMDPIGRKKKRRSEKYDGENYKARKKIPVH